MVNRVYVEKKEAFALEAKRLNNDLTNLLQIKNIKGIRVLNRYDADNISPEIFKKAVECVFSEPQVDTVLYDLDDKNYNYAFAVEYLPGQFDQRANSAEECIQIISKGDRPKIRTAKVYLINGELTDNDLDSIKSYVINPVEAREASLETVSTLNVEYKIPTEVETLSAFNSMNEDELSEFIKLQGLAMDIEDLKYCQEYFSKEKRNPTITEIKVIDTYWSDHCRHTTFNTTIDSIHCEDTEVQKAIDLYMNTRKELNRTKPVSLMDMGTIAAKYLKKAGLLTKLDESEEINACTVKFNLSIDGKEEEWLLLFKNETHNHPTEIEPFGGAATCIGGAIRDPLSGRSYVYSAMRVTGAANPLKPINETLDGKLPQRKIVTTAAGGYSSYGNQIGLATGQVDELYHDGYVAKRMEIGAVIAAAPAENVKRERPIPGDIVILLGGKTGRDGCGGATGASKSHTTESLETCGAEVQKGNAPEERKLQRLFRNPNASKMIKRCNDFGAGGVSVAIGELADGLDINLNAVPKKYEGLDGTELAISESQERMAVVVAKEDVNSFCELSNKENLSATIVAEVKESPYLTEYWNGKAIVNISREFLNTNGTEKHINVEIPTHKPFAKKGVTDFGSAYNDLVEDLNVCSKRGLSERFDSTIGAGTVMMPFGGKRQRTPSQTMVNLISTEKGHTDKCSLMAWGFNPFITENSPFHGGYLAVVESVSKLIASGACFNDVYLTFQEYFEKLGRDKRRWGKPTAAVLGALKAQYDLKIAAIGGKDSMSGSFEDIDVPPTLVSFAVTTEDAKHIITPEFKSANNKVIMLTPTYDKEGIPTGHSLIDLYNNVNRLINSGNVNSAYTPTYGGVGEAIFKMAIGNRIGFKYNSSINTNEIFSYKYGSFILEITPTADLSELNYIDLGQTTENYTLTLNDTSLDIEALESKYENKLESIYTCNIASDNSKPETYSFNATTKLHASKSVAVPKVLIPVFPGTNCEYDSAKAFQDAGADTEIFVINNLSPKKIEKSIDDFANKVKISNIIFIPGGFSGGDEPDGSGKFITAFFRNDKIKDAVTDLLDNREGLMLGICNGFQALVKLGLVPYGKIIDIDDSCPTLTFNRIGRHQSKIVRIKIASNKSPWLSNTNPGEIYSVPISHGEGMFIANESVLKDLADNNQISTQYVDLDGNTSYDVSFNPNGSINAIEGITSPDGRVLGKMGHAERIGKNLYKNVPGEYDMQMFKAAVEYFK